MHNSLQEIEFQTFLNAFVIFTLCTLKHYLTRFNINIQTFKFGLDQLRQWMWHFGLSGEIFYKWNLLMEWSFIAFTWWHRKSKPMNVVIWLFSDRLHHHLIKRPSIKTHFWPIFLSFWSKLQGPTWLEAISHLSRFPT